MEKMKAFAHGESGPLGLYRRRIGLPRRHAAVTVPICSFSQSRCWKGTVQLPRAGSPATVTSFSQGTSVLNTCLCFCLERERWARGREGGREGEGEGERETDIHADESNVGEEK